MNDQPSEETAITRPGVAPGLGYPNYRAEFAIEPIGWLQVSDTKAEHVSRETSGRVDNE
jgi:hypothetical protein